MYRREIAPRKGKRKEELTTTTTKIVDCVTGGQNGSGKSAFCRSTASEGPGSGTGKKALLRGDDDFCYILSHCITFIDEQYAYTLPLKFHWAFSQMLNLLNTYAFYGLRRHPVRGSQKRGGEIAVVCLELDLTHFPLPPPSVLPPSLHARQ